MRLPWPIPVRRRVRAETCPACAGGLVAGQIAVCRAGADGLAVTIYGLPFRACAAGCPGRRTALPDFPSRLVAAVLDGDGFPLARGAAGGAGAALHCRRCMSRSWERGAARMTVCGVVTLEPLAPFTVAVDAEGRTCASCGLAQLVPIPALVASLALGLRRACEAASLDAVS